MLLDANYMRLAKITNLILVAWKKIFFIAKGNKIEFITNQWYNIKKISKGVNILKKEEVIRFAISPELKEEFKKYCNINSESMSKVLETYVNNYVKDFNKNYEWMEKIINNLPKEKKLDSSGKEIEVIRLRENVTAKKREKNSNKLHLMMDI